MNYGLQLYSVRDITETDFEDALRQVAEMGYTMVEPAGFFGHGAKEVAAMLKAYGLTCCSTHTSLTQITEDIKGTIEFHKTIDCPDIIIPSAHFKTKKDLDLTIEQMNSALQVIEAEGMRLHYHNHSKEFWKNLDGQIAWEEIANRTNVLFEIDTFWAFNAGLDPVDVIEKYKDRVRFIHLKDGIPQDLNDPESKPQGRSLGSGIAPIEKVINKAHKLGITMVVESEDLSPTGPEEVKRCIDFLNG